MLQHLPRITAVVTLVTIFSLSSIPAAEAGCLSEYRECGNCANKRFNRALWNLDFDEMSRAFDDALDCEIDLMHCIFFGQHHQYSCA